MNSYDIIIIGSGVGGATAARRLSEAGLKILLIERGQFVAREPDNWDVSAVFLQRKYKAHDRWIDKAGKLFDPGMYYNVGGSTKFYGGAMFRLRKRDFDIVEHPDGVSPGWPYKYEELEPYYDSAEQLYRVHGDDRLDRTAPPRSNHYPFPPIESEPTVEIMAGRLREQGLSPSPIPLAVNAGKAGTCILCKTCDGFPCRLGQKNDAETCGVEPALSTGRTYLLTGAYARRLLTSPDGAKIDSVEVEHHGEIKHFSAPLFMVSCNAVNSAALLLRSANSAAPRGVANKSDVVGRNYMTHNQTALMGLSFKENKTVFQKTLAINDWYFGDERFPWPMGQMQMLGKLQGGMLTANLPFLPIAWGDRLSSHGIDWIGLSEDLPDPKNRVTVDGHNVRLAVTLNNMAGHLQLVKRMKSALRRAGYPVIVTKSLVAHATGHQCGTVRMGDNPSRSALDPYCRAWDHQNLFVVDASFFPSSAAVNPALTIAAQALRTADHILATDMA